MTLNRRTSALLALIAGAAVLSGCSGADAPVTDRTAVATAARLTADDCGGAALTVRQHLNSSDVGAVTVNGQCTNVTIDTGLADEDTAGGRQLCETAGEVAYTGDINSVTVRSKSGAELSVGIRDLKCLP